MEITVLLDFAAEAGRLLLESGAETSRVEDTLIRIIKNFSNQNVRVSDGEKSVYHGEALAVMTGFFVNIGAYTRIVRVRNRSVNLDVISKINTLSRDIADGKTDFDEAVKRLGKISKSPSYSLRLKAFAASMCCVFFTFLSGGSVKDAASSFAAGVLLYILSSFMKRHGSVEFIVTFLSGAVIALVAAVAARTGCADNADAVIIGSMTPLFPGLGITNAIRDIIAGDYLSGGARLFDSVVAASALASGAAAVMYMVVYLYERI